MASRSATIAFAALLVLVAIAAYLVGYETAGGPATVTVPTTLTSVREEAVVSPSTTTVVKTVVSEKVVTTTVVTEEVMTETIPVVVDALGRSITVVEPFERAVSLAPSITETVCAVGCCDKLVGVDDYSNYPPEVVEAVKEGRIARIGGYWTPDIERIAALSPDIVLASSGVPSHLALAEKLEELGIKVFYLNADKATSLSDVLEDAARVSFLLGCPGYEELAEELHTRLDHVREVLAEANATQPTVAVFMGSPEWGLWSAGGGTFIDYVITTAGAKNAFSRYHGWPQLSLEDVIAANPDYVIVASMGSAEDALQAWAKALKGLRAVEEGRLCAVTGPAHDALLRPGPRIADAVEIAASIVHPGLVEAPEDYRGYIACLGGKG